MSILCFVCCPPHTFFSDSGAIKMGPGMTQNSRLILKPWISDEGDGMSALWDDVLLGNILAVMESPPQAVKQTIPSGFPDSRSYGFEMTYWVPMMSLMTLHFWLYLTMYLTFINSVTLLHSKELASFLYVLKTQILSWCQEISLSWCCQAHIPPSVPMTV